MLPLLQDMEEMNRLEQELIEASQQYADAYYAEMAGLEEQSMMEQAEMGCE